MKFGKIIGRVISTKKVEAFEGLKLMLLQPVDEQKQETGSPIIVVDTLQSGIGEFVYYETSREASRVIEKEMNPCDSAVMGIIDEMHIKEEK